MTELVFLTLTEVLDLHQQLIEEFGGETGTRDLGLLESALAAPQSSFGGSFLHSSVFHMAAAYAFHISENQPFLDGNKRTGLASALTFLKLNGIVIKDPKRELYQAMMKISNREMKKEQLANLFSRLTKVK